MSRIRAVLSSGSRDYCDYPVESTDMKRNAIISGFAFLVMAGVNLGLKAKQGATGPENCSNFQVVSDNRVYSPGDRLHLKLFLTNNGKSPLYVSRQVWCGGPTGFAIVDIVDESGQRIAKNCYADETQPTDAELLELMTNPELWIQLQPGEIYGQERYYDLPQRRGTYRVKAYLIPPGFEKTQLTLLSQKGISVLRSLCTAPEISITVK
jgi:hypothetical protein